MAKGKDTKTATKGNDKPKQTSSSKHNASAPAYPGPVVPQVDPSMHAAAQMAANKDAAKVTVAKTAGDSAKKEERKSEKEQAKEAQFETSTATARPDLCLLCDYRIPQVEGAELHPLPDGTIVGNGAASRWAKAIDNQVWKVLEHSGNPALPENGGLDWTVILATDGANSIPDYMAAEQFGMILRQMHVSAKLYCEAWHRHRDDRERKANTMVAAAKSGPVTSPSAVDKNPDFDNTAKAAKSADYGAAAPKTKEGDQKYIPDMDNDGYSEKDMTEYLEDQGLTVQKGEDKEPVQQKGESNEDYKQRYREWSTRQAFEETGGQVAKQMDENKQQYAEEKGLTKGKSEDSKSFADKVMTSMGPSGADIKLSDDPSMLLQDPNLLLQAGVYIPAQITDLLEAGIRDIQRLNNLQVGKACEDVPAEKSNKPKTNKKSGEKAAGKAKKKPEEEIEEYIPPFLVPRSTIDRNIVGADREVTVINRHLFDDDLWTLNPPFSPNWISPGESINVLKTDAPQDVDPFRFASGKYWYFDGAEEKMAVEIPIEENREAVLGDIGGTVGIPFNISSEQESWSINNKSWYTPWYLLFPPGSSKADVNTYVNGTPSRMELIRHNNNNVKAGQWFLDSTFTAEQPFYKVELDNMEVSQFTSADIQVKVFRMDEVRIPEKNMVSLYRAYTEKLNNTENLSKGEHVPDRQAVPINCDYNDDVQKFTCEAVKRMNEANESMKGGVGNYVEIEINTQQGMKIASLLHEFRMDKHILEALTSTSVKEVPYAEVMDEVLFAASQQQPSTKTAAYKKVTQKGLSEKGTSNLKKSSPPVEKKQSSKSEQKSKTNTKMDNKKESKKLVVEKDQKGKGSSKTKGGKY